MAMEEKETQAVNEISVLGLCNGKLCEWVN
jgi:hypothetical protein